MSDWQHDEWWRGRDELAVDEVRRAIGLTGDQEDARDE